MLSRLYRARTGTERSEPPAAEGVETGRRSLIAFAPAAARVGARPRKRAAWLKLAIPFAALLVFGAIGLPGSQTTPASLLVLQGAVEIDDQIQSVGAAELPLARHARVVAGAAARARLREGESEIELTGEGMLRCEAFGPLRVHLFAGALQCRGACSVSTALGVVQSSGGALELRLVEDGLHMLAGAPGASFLDGSGRRALAVGEELHVAPEAPR
jgi:hypothetical protein